jgi:hypothetical protein
MAANFENSFKKGLEAAEAASQVNLEIDSVFEELNNQIHSASEGRIKFELRRKRDNISALSSLVANGFDSPIKVKTYIVAINDAAKKEEELAQFERASTGYPCHLDYEDQKIFCNDRSALEKHLSIMLSSVNTGKKMARLLNYPTRSSPDPADDE